MGLFVIILTGINCFNFFLIQGHFGKVYKGRFNEMDVAVKMCKGIPTEEQTKNFLKEGMTLKALNHENIIRFIGNGVTKNSVMIVMEYASGKLTD